MRHGGVRTAILVARPEAATYAVQWRIVRHTEEDSCDAIGSLPGGFDSSVTSRPDGSTGKLIDLGVAEYERFGRAILRCFSASQVVVCGRTEVEMRRRTITGVPQPDLSGSTIRSGRGGAGRPARLP